LVLKGTVWLRFHGLPVLKKKFHGNFADVTDGLRDTGRRCGQIIQVRILLVFVTVANNKCTNVCAFIIYFLCLFRIFDKPINHFCYGKNQTGEDARTAKGNGMLWKFFRISTLVMNRDICHLALREYPLPRIVNDQSSADE
jgi:hypothetical protein